MNAHWEVNPWVFVENRTIDLCKLCQIWAYLSLLITPSYFLHICKGTKPLAFGLEALNLRRVCPGEIRKIMLVVY